MRNRTFARYALIGILASASPFYLPRVSSQSPDDDKSIRMVVEGYLKEGNQPVPANPADIQYGVSVTDACLSWETTERMLRHGHAALRDAARVMETAAA